MKLKLSSRIVSGMTAILLIACSIPSTLFTAAAVGGSLEISTLDDLKNLASNCSSDSYSDGLTVYLTSDIDADGTDISIPIFLGTFDGQGHTISNLSLTGSNSNYGLFGYIESGATVKDLSVEGEVIPTGSQENIGGIAGINNGTIENVTFSGAVIGESSVGGIVGLNESSGTISGSSSSGLVHGNNYTGGIAGTNAGTLLKCTNEALINTTVSESDITIADLENAESTLYSILKRENVSEVPVTSDTGGIVGYSSGAVQSCKNNGAVGYSHVGYNVGGIAGRQNGYLANCENYGEIQGRKDVGGIVGQMVPDITLSYSDGCLDELQDELSSLQSKIDQMLSDAESASDSISNRISRISGYANSAQSSAVSIGNNVTETVNDAVSDGNDVLLLVERYLDKLSPILEDLQSSSDSAEQSLTSLHDMISTLDDSTEYTEDTLSKLLTFCTDLENSCASLLTGADALDNGFSVLSNDPAMPDTSSLRSTVSSLKESVSSLKSVLNEAETNGAISKSTKSQIKRYTAEVLNNQLKVNKAIVSLLKNTDFEALRSQNEATIRKAVSYFQTAMSSFFSGGNHILNAVNHLHSAIKSLSSMDEDIDSFLSEMDKTLSSAESATSSLSSALNKTSEWASDLSGENIENFSVISSTISDSGETLSTSLNAISNELDALTGEMDSSSTTLLSDVRAVNNQFMSVMNIFMNLLNNTQNIDYTDVFEDISEESLKNATRGKVLECINYGAVTSDRNVGGIAGSMAIEYDTDPEDDLLSSESSSLHFTYQTKAILLDCKNYGNIQSKKSCAGGIVGRMDIGTVSGCSEFGSISSESGDYIGGIAGISLSSIRSSYAKCFLSGRNYVGGITGSGKKLSDCVSMVEITDATQFYGAVAGETTGDCSENVFVSDTLAGIDRISYSGIAEKISYETLCTLEDIPEEFQTLTLTFKAQDTVLKEISFHYGDSFTNDGFPNAPSEDGKYVLWDKTDLTNLHFDTVVTASYESYIMTLSCNEDENRKSKFLTEGLFCSGDVLSAVSNDLSDTPKGTVEAWTLSIPNDGQEEHNVRVLIEDESADSYTIYTLQESKWIKVSSEAIGSYLCFNLPNDSTQIAIVQSGTAALWIWLIGGLTVITVIIFILFLHKKRHHK